MTDREVPASRVRARVYQALADDLTGGMLHRVVNVSLIALIALNVIAVITQTVHDIGVRYATLLHGFEVFSVAVFTVEYALRLWACALDGRYGGSILGRLRYATTPLAIADLMAFLPFYLPMVLPLDLRFLRVIRLSRLVRILKIGRYSESSTLLWRVLHAKKGELLIVVYGLLTLLVMASSAMYYVEHDAQPRAFASIPAAMWWALVTLTTVGYGDIYPITAMGKVLAGVVSIVGIAIFALPAGILAAGFAEHVPGRTEHARVCPHCGRPIHDLELGAGSRGDGR